MTLKAYQILKKQQLWKRGMETKGYRAPEGYEDLVFTATKNTPISPRDTTVVMKFITERIRKKRPDFEPVTSIKYQKSAELLWKVPFFQGKFPTFNKTLTYVK